MDAPPRLLARHPAAAGHGDAAVERDRRLVRDERPAEGLPDAPRLVLPARGEVVEELDLDPGGAEPLDPATVDHRVRVAAPTTTRATPAATTASAQGGVRPWWEHGSSVT